MKLNSSHNKMEATTTLGLRSPVIQKPFQAEGAILTLLRILSQPTTKGATTLARPLLLLIPLRTRDTV